VTDDDRIRAAVERVWQQNRDTLLGRLVALERAAAALAEGGLDDELRAHAEREAHRLVGSAGTLGRMRASETARELEHLLGHAQRAEDDPARVATLVGELREQLSDDPD
jgi:HPt (histidine-containing phosphotransfer) domain-containing protein